MKRAFACVFTSLIISMTITGCTFRGPQEEETGMSLSASPVDSTADFTNSPSCAVLAPWTAMDPYALYTTYLIPIDWNGDGVEDEFRQESGKIRYTDGKTGEMTDLTKKIIEAHPEHPIYFQINKTCLLCQNAKGGYGLLITYDLDSSDHITYAFDYDPDGIVACRPAGSVTFQYRDGSLYIRPYSELLGNTLILWQEAVLAEDFTFTGLSDTKYFCRECEAYLYHSITAATDVDIGLESGTGYEKSTIPEGAVILPDRIVSEDSGITYLYVSLENGSTGRMTCDDPFARGETGTVTINGIDQTRLFNGLNFGG